MVNEVKVSVFCLAYNHEKYIRHTLDGFVMQRTDFKFEVLIHDDASTDSTAAIIREYEEKYPEIIKPIYQKENQYSKHVRIINNFLLPIARGKYIAYCEGDDYWTDPLKLQKQFDAMEAHPGCSICLHRVQFINEDGSITDRALPKKIQSRGLIKSKNKWQLFFGRHAQAFQTSSFFICKDVYSEQNNEIELLYQFWTGDGTILSCAIRVGEVYYLDETMSRYRMHSIGSWTSTICMSQSPKLQISRHQKCILGFIYYDMISRTEFHKFCAKNILCHIVDIAHFDPIFAQSLIKKLGISFYKVVCKIPSKRMIQYFAIRYLPGLYKKYLSKRNTEIRINE